MARVEINRRSLLRGALASGALYGLDALFTAGRTRAAWIPWNRPSEPAPPAGPGPPGARLRWAIAPGSNGDRNGPARLEVRGQAWCRQLARPRVVDLTQARPARLVEGAWRTSSSSGLIIDPIRITLAGCSMVSLPSTRSTLSGGAGAGITSSGATALVPSWAGCRAVSR